MEVAERRADREQIDRLEHEVDRLRADLRQAEETLIAAESGLRAATTRADAVSSVADARIQVERATERAPWRGREIREAREKLREAERQLKQGSFTAAIFFASRAQRAASTLVMEAEATESMRGLLRVSVAWANLREGPSTATAVTEVLMAKTPVYNEKTDGDWHLVRTPWGKVGWMHGSVLE
jgi:chromosome segregation ATPase